MSGIFHSRRGRRAAAAAAAVVLILAGAASKLIRTPDIVPAASDNRETLRIELFDRSDDINGAGTYDSAKLIEWIQSSFGDPNNVDIEFVTVPREDETTELNKYMASGSGPDIMFTYNPYYFGSYAKNGQLTELTELIDTGGENIRLLLGDELLKNGMFEGKLYAVPAKRMFTGKYVSYIRKDWLDELGLDIPENTEELVYTLRQFRDRLGGDVIPFSSQSGNSAAVKTFIANMCMDRPESEVSAFSDPDYREALKFMNSLYNEGLLGSGYAADTNSVTHYANISEGKVGFFMDTVSSVAFDRIINVSEMMKQNDPEAELAVCDAITSDTGEHFKEVNSDTGLYVFIPAYSTKAELAVKYLNWLADPEVIKTLQSGDIDGGNRLSLSFDLSLLVNGFYADTTEESLQREAESYGEYSQLFIDACRSSLNDGFCADVPPEEIVKSGNADRISGIIDKYVTECITAPPGSFDETYERSERQFRSELSGIA